MINENKIKIKNFKLIKNKISEIVSKIQYIKL